MRGAERERDTTESGGEGGGGVRGAHREGLCRQTVGEV